MRNILMILLTFFATHKGFANTHLDPFSLSWMANLNAQTPQLIEEYKAEVAAITAQQAASSQQCPAAGVCKTSDSFEALLKTHASSLQQPLQKQSPQLLVFASFSMDTETLKSLAQSLKRIGGSLVFRGLVNDSFKNTGKAFQDLGEEALIDPTLFRTYHVTAVPTFVLRQEALNPEIPVSPTPVSPSPLIFDKISGNVTLDYALSQFADKGEVKAARELLSQLREKD